MKTARTNFKGHASNWKGSASMQEMDSILEYGDVECEFGKSQGAYDCHEKKMGNVHSSGSDITLEALTSSMNEMNSTKISMNKSGSGNETNEIDKKQETKSKLNPAAEQFHAKGTYAEVIQGVSVNSFPNNNSASQNSSLYTGLTHSSMKHNIRKTNLEMSEKIGEVATQALEKEQHKLGSPLNSVSNHDELKDLLKQYIMKKCSLNSHCNGEDFDGTALDGLTKLSFIQSLQAVEHYGASVSERILKKSAYLMGIIRGQESHWENSRAAAQLEGSALQLLHLPKRLLIQIGKNCLHGNCLPSDFTPEVILSLHSLTVDYALKAISAFDANKRIVAGCKGGVVNRPRFLQRLIENVIQQNPISLATLKKSQMKSQASNEETGPAQNVTGGSTFSSPKSFLSLLGSGESQDMDEVEDRTPNSGSSPSQVQLSLDEKLKFLERELTDRIERERRLRQELGNLRVQVGYWEKECHRLNSTITHILHNRQ